MQKKHMWNRVPATAALFIAGALGLAGVACGTNPSAHNDLEEVSETMALLDIPGLSFTGTCAFNPINGNLLLTLGTSNAVIVGRDSGNGNIAINGNSTTCGAANYANLKDLNIIVNGGGVGTSETVVLDYSNGTFGLSTGVIGTGTQYDTGGDTGATNDYLSFRMTNSNTLNQNITIGTNGIYLSASNFNDVLILNAHNPNWLTFALGAGNDRVSAKGATALGGPAGQAVTIFGNDGADTLYTSGSNFNDVYSGGNGNDTIYVASAVSTGHQLYDGNTGIDTVDFSSRALSVKIYNNGAFVSGDVAGNENCLVANSEILVGGSGGDIIQGGAAGVNHWLYGGPGNDNFVQGGTGTGDSNDVISGGPGIDGVYYTARTIPVNVFLDGNPNDGSVNEIDNVGVDVENIYAGIGADVLVGNSNSNIIDGGGGAGANTLTGGAGDDIFLQSASATDTIVCGTGTDTIDYSPRSVAITALLDGNPSSGAGGVTEGDTLGLDCENLNGAGSGSGAQSLTGNAGDNVISGGLSGGAVTINCLGGEDIAIGDTSASNHPGVATNCEIFIP